MIPISFVGYRDMRDEIFREITYPGVIRNRYEISNYGRVYSNKSRKFLKYHIDKDGYHRIGLTTPNHPKRWKNYSIHRLAAYEFVYNPNPNKNTVVNHMDGVKDNNYYLNLEYCTDMENRIHAVENNLMCIGEQNCMNKFSKEFVHEICKYLSDSKTPIEICNIYGYRTSKDNIPLYDLARNISLGNTWKHISKQYGL